MTIRPFAAPEFINFVREETGFEPETFARTEKLGEDWGFSELVPAIRLIHALLKEMASLPLDKLRAHIRDELLPITQGLHKLREEVMAFDSVPSEQLPNPMAQRQELLERADKLAIQAFGVFSPLVAYLSAVSDDREKHADFREEAVRETRQILQSLRQDAESTRSEKEDIIRQANAALETVRAASADVGVSKHAVHFLQEADRHQKSSRLWLKATITLTVFAFVLSGLSLWHSLCTPETFPDSLPATLSKLALLAVAYYAVIWAARVYRSERHNAVINRHRHNALKSFQTFADGSRDETTKDAVLLRATDSIFSHQPSGFSDKAQESGNPKILEVFRNLSAGSQE